MPRSRPGPRMERVFERSRLDAEARAAAYERLVPIVRCPLTRDAGAEKAMEAMQERKGVQGA
jgi:hypothetical protein